MDSAFAEKFLNFYEVHDPSKVESARAILAKFKGKPEKLVRALVRKYGDTAKDYFAK